MSESLESVRRDLDLCNEHRELADLLIEHGCAPAGEDRPLFRALIEREADLRSPEPPLLLNRFVS